MVKNPVFSYTKLRFILKGHGHLNKKRIFRLDYLKTPSNIPIFFDQFEYRIENADTNIKLFLYYIEFCYIFLSEKWLPSVAQNLSWDSRAVGLDYAAKNPAADHNSGWKW